MYGTKKLATKNFSLLQAWINFGKYPRLVAEVNDNSQTDIVGFGYDNMFVSFEPNNRSFGEWQLTCTILVKQSFSEYIPSLKAGNKAKQAFGLFLVPFIYILRDQNYR